MLSGYKPAAHPLPTPRTDAYEQDRDGYKYVSAYVARELERENAELRAERKEEVSTLREKCRAEWDLRIKNEAELRAQLELLTLRWKLQCEAAETAERQRDEALKDAERYRWVRSKNTGPSMLEKVSDDCQPPYFTLKCEAELDAAIDAAKEKSNG